MLTKQQQRTLYVSLLLAVITFLLYCRAAGFDFISFDDPEYFVKNSNLQHGFNWQTIKWFFQAGYSGNWHPLTWLSHWLDYEWFGLNPFGPHLVNALLHAANSALLFLVLFRITNALGRSLTVAALFAWHPTHVESVAWVSERKDVLSAMFWILTLWVYIRYVDTLKERADGERGVVGPARRAVLGWFKHERSPRRGAPTLPTATTMTAGSATLQRSRSWLLYTLTIFSFVLALMAKPMAVTLPFILLLLDWWPLGRFSAGQAAAPISLVLEKIPFFALSAGSCVLTMMAQRRARAVASLEDLSMLERMANSTLDYVRYIGKLFWPVKLSFIYPLIVDWERWQVALAALILIAILGLVVAFAKSKPYLLFGWLWYLGTLVPVIGLVQVGAQSMADRYTYIPSIGLFIMVCWGVYDLAGNWRYRNLALGAGAAVICGICGALTERQLSYWKNSATLYARALDLNPQNYLVHSDYGVYLRDLGQLKEAEAECRRAVEIAPEYAIGHLFLAGILVDEGKNLEAASEIKTALQYEPDRVPARVNLAAILFSEKKYDQAEAEYREALDYAPKNAKLHFSLGQALYSQGKFTDARREFEAAFHLLAAAGKESTADFPGMAFTQEDIVTLLESLGDIAVREKRYSDALVVYRRAISIRPKDGRLHRSLGMALTLEGDFTKAQDELEQAIKIDPSDASAHYELAKVLCQRTDFQRAIAEYRAAVNLQPNFPDALNNLAWILATSPDPRWRNGQDAIQLAGRACALTHTNQPAKIETLAAAYAEAGRFADAISAAKLAHETAEKQGDAAIAARNAELIKLYESHKAYHEPK